jgi:pimeloyl-ACP methyl ester carboxylesterase
VFDNQAHANPVLLIHGLGGSIDSWRDNIRVFEKNHRVVAIDLPGFGESDKPKMSYSIRFYTDFVARLVRQIMPKKPVAIIGSSLGGQIAAEIAIKYHQLVSKLVLISPAGIPPFSFKGSAALRKYVMITRAKNQQQVASILASIEGKPVNDQYASALYERISMPGAREAFREALKESAKAPRLTSRIRLVSCPALVLWGQNDKMIPAKYASPLIGLENFRVILIDHCGHRPHADAPKIFNNAVLSFLAKN